MFAPVIGSRVRKASSEQALLEFYIVVIFPKPKKLLILIGLVLGAAVE